MWPESSSLQPTALDPGGGARVLDFHPDCPLRPPDWRWRRAQQLFDAAARPRRWDDSTVRRARDFLAGLRRCRRRGDRQRLADRLPAVHGAHELERGENHRRWEVQARLLARESVPDIADKTATVPATIAAYAQLFFDVSDRMRSRGYIIHRAVGLYRPPPREDDGRIVRLLGYLGGPFVLDALLHGHMGIVQPARSEELASFCCQFVSDQLRLKTLVAALTMPVDGRAGRALLRTLQRFEALERRLRRTTPSADDLLPRVELMTEHFPDLGLLTGTCRG